MLIRQSLLIVLFTFRFSFNFVEALFVEVLSLALSVKNIIFLFQMVEDPLQLLRIKCVADEQGDGVLGNFINRSG